MSKADKLQQLKASMKLMEKAGAKFPKFGKALNLLGPLVSATMIFEGLRKLPVIGDVMEGIDKVDAWVTSNTLGRIPVLKWSNALKKAGQNFLSGGDMSIKDYVKNEENDKAWYMNEETDANLKFPVNIKRDMSMYKKLITNNVFYSTVGAVPKLMEMILDPWECSNNRLIDSSIDTIWSALRGNLRTNITYEKTQLKAWLLNNISLYAVAKHLERKLCMRKFKDPEIDYKAWLSIWTAKEVNHGNNDTWAYLQPNENFNADSEEFSTTLNLYHELCKEAKNFVLPSHFKQWIDHYFGSIFTLDNEVANNKYLCLKLDTINMYNYIKATDSIEIVNLSLSNFTNDVSNFIELVHSFFADKYNDSMFADFTKATTLPNVQWKLGNVVLGWLTKYDDYEPVAISDAGIVQALVNAYTNNVADQMYNLDLNHVIRLDSMDNLDDYLTTILFLGTLIAKSPKSSIYNTRTLSVKCINVLLYADSSNTLTIPAIMLSGQTLSDQAGIEQSQHFTITAPISIAFTSSQILDIRTQGQVHDGESLIYYPYYNKSSDSISALSSDSYFIGNGSATVKSEVLGRPLYLGQTPTAMVMDCYFIIPLVSIESGNYLVYAISKTHYLGDKLTTWGTSVDLFYINREASCEINGIEYLAEDILSCFGKNLPIFLLNDTDASALKSASNILSTYNDETATTLFAVQTFKLSRTFDGYMPMLNLTLSGTCELQCRSQDSESHDMPTGYDSLNNLLIPEYQKFLIETATEAEPSLTIVNRLYKEYWFTVLGYFIPIVNSVYMETSIGEGSPISGYNKTYIINIIKEDFTPYEMSIDDMPYIINSMYSGLFNIVGSLNVSRTVDKTE